MRRIIPWMATGLFLFACAASADEILVDGIAAQVGEDVVLYSDVLAMVADGEKKMRAAGASEDQIVKLRAQAIIDWRNQDVKKAYEEGLAQQAKAAAAPPQ